MIIDKRDKLVFIVSAIFGFLAHGFLINNAFYGNVNDASYVLGGASIIAAVGRYIGCILNTWMIRLGFSAVIKPANIILCLFFVSIINMLLVRLFDIKKNHNIVLFSAIFMLQPALISILAYNFVCHIDGFSALLMIMGLYIILKCEKNLYQLYQ